MTPASVRHVPAAAAPRRCCWDCVGVTMTAPVSAAGKERPACERSEDQNQAPDELRSKSSSLTSAGVVPFTLPLSAGVSIATTLQGVPTGVHLCPSVSNTVGPPGLLVIATVYLVKKITTTTKHAFQESSLENAIKRCVSVLTPGAAGDTSAPLPKAGTLQHHPAFVGFFPSLPHHVGRGSAVVVATLSCNTTRRKIRFTQSASNYYAFESSWCSQKGDETEVGERIQIFFLKRGWRTHPRVCTSTPLCRFPDRHTPACSWLCRGVSSTCPQFCKTFHLHGNGLEMAKAPLSHLSKGDFTRLLLSPPAWRAGKRLNLSYLQ